MKAKPLRGHKRCLPAIEEDHADELQTPYDVEFMRIAREFFSAGTDDGLDAKRRLVAVSTAARYFEKTADVPVCVVDFARQRAEQWAAAVETMRESGTWRTGAPAAEA